MPHADSSLVPDTIQTKAEFWDHVYTQLEALFEGERYWISNLSNASSLIYNSLLAFEKYFGKSNDKAVNWCGFYIHSKFFPAPTFSVINDVQIRDQDRLLLGPFSGKPACQFIQVTPGKVRGVCGNAYTKRQTVLVEDVDAYPGHIACDGETKSEIVIPLIIDVNGESHALGVLDLDCLALNGFDEEDKKGLEKIANLIVHASNW